MAMWPFVNVVGASGPSHLVVKLSRDTAKRMAFVGQETVQLVLARPPRQAICVAKERFTVVVLLAGGLIWQAGKASGQGPRREMGPLWRPGICGEGRQLEHIEDGDG